MNNDKYVTVSWYEHGCDWITKSCDDYCKVYAMIPKDVADQYRVIL